MRFKITKLILCMGLVLVIFILGMGCGRGKSIQSESSTSDLEQSQPLQSESDASDLDRSQGFQSELVQSELVQSESVQSESVHSGASQDELDQEGEHIAQSGSGEDGAGDKSTEEAPKAHSGPVVAIDVGHQAPGQDMTRMEANGPGSDVMKNRLATGTTGSVSGLAEYELNLAVSLKLQKELEQRGYQVIMTRTTDEVDLGNIDRAEIANEGNAQALIRIHANGSEDGSVYGALTMSPTQSNPFVGDIAEECMKLSQLIVDEYCLATGLSNRGILAEDTMTGINWSKVPVTILEMGFMTNQGDDAYMADSSNQDSMVQGIANGVDAYFGR